MGLPVGTHVNIFVSKEYDYVELNEEIKAIGQNQSSYAVLSAEVIDNKCSGIEEIHKGKATSHASRSSTTYVSSPRIVSWMVFRRSSLLQLQG